jgi:uncharacterized protein (DUF2267 family)
MSQTSLSRAQAGYLYGDEWRNERFVITIEQKASLSWTQAEQAPHATLQTLAEGPTRRQARELPAELPPPLSEWLSDAGPYVELCNVDEFVQRVAAREHVDPERAEGHVRAAFITLLVRGEEIAHLGEHLPADYKRLLGEAARRHRDPTAPEPMSVDDFLKLITNRTALDPPDADRATSHNLPAELRLPLERLIQRIAQREEVSFEEALDHAPVVFAALRQSLPDKCASACRRASGRSRLSTRSPAAARQRSSTFRAHPRPTLPPRRELPRGQRRASRTQ